MPLTIMLVVKTVIAYIIGIILAECENILVPATLLCSAFIGLLFLKKYKKESLLVIVSALASIIALHDKENENRQEQFSQNKYFGVTKHSATNILYENISSRIDTIHLTLEAKALAKGLLLGEKQALDKSQKQDIRNAGMSHIIAISGLHIGIIFVVILGLLTPLRMCGLLHLPHFISITIVWVYISIVGFPASAVRAATMFSLVVLSRLYKRETSGIGILSSTALIMLLCNTQQLWNVGFQLSFLAALGILLAKPVLERQNKIEQLITVSLSAQLATMPIVAYYFHFVPIFSWIQGILVVPLLPLLIYSTLVLLIFPSLEFLSFPIEWLSHWLFYAAQKISAIETWCLGGKILWYPTLGETIFLEILCILCLIYVFNKTKKQDKSQPFR